MNSHFSRLALLAFSASLACSGTALAQRTTTTAREAVDLVSTRFGPRAVQWLAEVRAQGGTPQPTDWEILSYDDRAPRLLYRFWAGRGRADDGGTEEQRYPHDVPVGYFSPNQIGVDSVAAFTIAEGEAREAKVSFDSCDYLLRVREFSTEPIWRLSLLDAARHLVGKIYLSANSGEVLRTLWVYRGDRARPDGRPRIVDSFAPTRNSTTSGFTRNEEPALEPPLDPGGVVRVPPILDPGSDGDVAGVPRVPVPQPPRPSAPESGGGAPQPYRPAAPDGPMVDDGIPDPPALEDEGGPPSDSTSGRSENPGEPGGRTADSGNRDPNSSRRREMPDPRDGTAEPPIDVPEGEGGSDGRIPPPPVPQ